MNQDKPKEVRTLSIRIPMDLYLDVSQHALDNDSSSLNAAIIDLITHGLRAEQEESRIISKFILEVVPQEKLKEIMNGRQASR